MNSPAPFPCWFRGHWTEALFVHFAVAPEILQPWIPYRLDLHEQSAFVTFVLFTMRDMRPVAGGSLARLPFWLVRRQRFLNVRTYVTVAGRPGIHFIAEWISDPLCVLLGKPLYALPYHWGQHDFCLEQNHFRGAVREIFGKLRYVCEAQLPERGFAPCASESRDEFLLERYAAFNGDGARGVAFRIAHRPWEQANVPVRLLDVSLLRSHFPWFGSARFAGANYSPGTWDVWMGKPEEFQISDFRFQICNLISPTHDFANHAFRAHREMTK